MQDNGKSKSEQAGLWGRALERTVGAEDFTPRYLKAELEKTIPADSVNFSSVDIEKTPTGNTLTSLTDTPLSPDLLVDPTIGTERFEIQGMIGKGATARVYSVKDNSLNRTVAVKLLSRKNLHAQDTRGQFMHEARVTAMLEHPNIMPVYNIGETGNNELYFVMKRIGGVSLGDSIKARIAGKTVARELCTVDGLIGVFLKVCDALAYAHSRGFIHQDVKPDNIMAGEYGEVLLLDWGSALGGDDQEQGRHLNLFGTPAYMSPEQARREPPSERSDVYCLGATFFRALTLRYHFANPDPDEFWKGKKAGSIDPPTDQERRNIPAAVLTIVLKALAPDPQQRYESVAAFADELKRYQAGLAVRAHRETLPEKFGRWYRRNTRAFWIGSVSAVLMSVLGGVLLGEKIDELIRWRTVFEDDFSAYHSSRDLRQNWRALVSEDWVTLNPDTLGLHSAWQIRDGQLIGTGKAVIHNLVYNGQIWGDLRVEWDCTPLVNATNLNCFIGGRDRMSGYTFHVASHNDTRLAVLTKVSPLEPLARRELPAPFVQGRTYRFRMEKVEDRIRLLIDGVVIFDVHDVDVLTGPGHQSFGIEVQEYRTVAFDNFKVSYRPLPLKTSPLVVARQYQSAGQYHLALEQYQSLIAAYPRSALIPEALFGVARCQILLDSLAAAEYTMLEWLGRFENSPLVPYVILELAEVYSRSGRAAVADSLYEILAESHPGGAVAVVVVNRATARALQLLGKYRADVPIEPLAQSQMFAQIDSACEIIELLCHRLGVSVRGNPFFTQVLLFYSVISPLSDEKLLERFAGQDEAMANLLLDRQNPEAVLRYFPNSHGHTAMARMALGDYAGVIASGVAQDREIVQSLCSLGRYSEVLEHYAHQRIGNAVALLALGKYEELTKEHSDQIDLSMIWAARAGTVDSLLQRDLFHFARARVLFNFSQSDSALAAFPQFKDDSLSIWDLALYTSIEIDRGNAQGVIDRFKITNPNAASFILDAMTSLCRESEFPDSHPVRKFVAEKHLGRGQFDLITRAGSGATNLTKALVHVYGVNSNVLDTSFYYWQYLRALTHFLAGNMVQVRDSFPGQPRLRAAAMIALGEGATVLDSFSAFRDMCCYALCALGRTDEAAEKYPDLAEIWAAHSLANQRPQPVVDAGLRVPPRVRALAYLQQGRPIYPLRTQGDWRLRNNEWFELSRLEGLEAYIDKKYGLARKKLFAEDLFYYRWSYAGQRFERFFLGPVLAGLESGTDALNRALDSVLTPAYRYTFCQTVYYEGALLRGDLSAQAFLEQPLKYLAEARHDFYAAVRADIAGEHNDALLLYQRIAQLPLHIKIPFPPGTIQFDALLSYNIFRDEVVMRFVGWRIEELSKKRTLSPQVKR